MYLLKALFFAVAVTIAIPLQAATLYIDPPSTTLNRGDAVTLSVRLDTNESEFECVNAVDAIITYSDNISLVDVSVGESILPVWVESPKIDKMNRRITLAGGIPNGYCGRVSGDPRLTNKIVELIFKAPGLTVGGGDTSPIAEINFAPESSAYLNDGFGTNANLSTLGAKIELTQSVGTEIINDWREEIQNDNIPPEPFSISLEHSDTAFNQNYYIVFNTTDKQTGISHYEVLEEAPREARLFSFGAATAPWHEVTSPYVLSDQSLRSTIRVRALDKAGNEYIATFAPQVVGRDMFYLYVIAVIGTFLFAFAIILLIVRSYKRKKHALTAEK